MISTGLRVNSAADSAAYWSISTTMKSDKEAISSVRDSIALSLANVAVASAGMEHTIDALDKIGAALVMASSSGADLTSLQKEITAQVAMTRSTTQSATVSGHNWLSTDITDLVESSTSDRTLQLVSSYSRNAGAVTTGTIPFDVIKTSLYNSDGGGILESDPRSPKSLGGIRGTLVDGSWSQTNGNSGSYGHRDFTFTGPTTFGASDSMTFDLVVDGDDPNPATNGGISSPFNPGNAASITINRSVVDAALPANNGVITTYQEMITVLNRALNGTGAGAAYLIDAITLQPIPDRMRIYSNESSGLNGSFVSIANLASTVGTAGISNFADYGERGSSLSLQFQPFKVFSGVEINFNFSSDLGAAQPVQITRDVVNTVLGKSDGSIATSAEMATLLQSLIGQPGLLIQDSGGNVVVKTDPSTDRLNGFRSRIGFTGIKVNIEPLVAIGLEDIDIVANPDKVSLYLRSVQTMASKVRDGATSLGALKNTLDMQATFATAMMNTLGTAAGALVDADMDALSAQLKAAQVQEQLATQSMMIASENPKALLTLFDGR